MSNLRNSVRLIGNLGKAPDVKEVSEGRKMARFSVATHDTYTNQKGEKVEETNWHNLVAWGKLAEVAEKYLRKGSEVAVEGKLSSRSYTDKDGNKKYITEVVVNNLQMLGKKEAVES
jgi:single-strand DNA-binding protein